MNTFESLKDDTTEVLSVRVMKQMKEDLKAEAKRRRVRISDLVRWWIASELYPVEEIED